MAITTEIDLTLESDFASEYNHTLLPDRKRRREESTIFKKSLIEIMGIIINIEQCEEFSSSLSFSCFFRDVEYEARLLDYTINCYYMFFGMSPRLLKRWGELDPYAGYFFGAGIFCDCCGVELNVLNTGNYICCKCEKRDGLTSLKLS